MTSTATRRTIRQTTARVRSRGRDREVIITLAGSLITCRLKGERKSFSLPASVVYSLAVQSHCAAEKARKRAERAARKAKP